MPINSGPSNGETEIVAALPIISPANPLTFTIASTQFSRELHSDNLPGVNAWLLWSAGVGGVSFQVEFAQGRAIGGVNWQPLNAPTALAFGVPTIFNARLGSFRHRIRIIAAGAATVDYRLTASLT